MHMYFISFIFNNNENVIPVVKKCKFLVSRAEKKDDLSHIKNIRHKGSAGSLNPAPTYRQLGLLALLESSERKISLLGITCFSLKKGSRRTGCIFSCWSK